MFTTNMHWHRAIHAKCQKRPYGHLEETAQPCFWFGLFGCRCQHPRRRETVHSCSPLTVHSCTIPPSRVRPIARPHSHQYLPTGPTITSTNSSLFVCFSVSLRRPALGFSTPLHCNLSPGSQSTHISQGWCVAGASSPWRECAAALHGGGAFTRFPFRSFPQLESLSVHCNRSLQ